jgi:hypothetical protein
MGFDDFGAQPRAGVDGEAGVKGDRHWRFYH